MLRRHAAWVAALAVLVFVPVLLGGFVYDDDWTLTNNASLRRPFGELLSLLATGDSLAARVPNATRPFLVVSFWLERRLFGSSAFGYHLHSLLLYGLCCAFATFVAFELTRRRSVALFAGSFFALAPLHTEVVAAINYRTELYAGLAVLAALACLFASPVRRRKKRPASWLAGDGFGRAGLVAAVVAVGLFAKESAAALVPLLGLLLFWDERLRALARSRPRTLAAIGGALALYALWRLPLLLHGDDLPLAPERGFWQQLLRAARFELTALRLAFLPWDHNPDRFRQPDATVNSLLALTVLAAGVVVLGRVRATRIPALGVALALVAPLPSSPLVRPINELADRYFFVGVLGGGLFWGWCLMRLGALLKPGVLLEAFRWVRRTPLGLGLLCLPLAIPSWQAVKIWRTNRTLWEAAVVLNPSSARAFLNLSRQQKAKGELDAARDNLEHAIRLVPNYAPALLARVVDDIEAKDMETARRHVDEILALGLGKARGVSRAVECVKLEPEAAKRCAEHGRN
jgi:hypothetical protein